MKRIFTTVFSVIMALTLAVFASGCSGCNGNPSLNFNQNFYGKGEPTVGYKESLTYSVKYDDDYNSDLRKSQTLTDEIVSYDYIGEYKTILQVENALPSEIETNISTEQMPIYHLSTALTLKSTYKVNGEYVDGGVENGDGTVSYDEYVKSEVYFLKAGHSFAPIYSKIEQQYTYVVLGGNKASIDLYNSSSTINYNNYSYKITTLTDGQTQTKNYDYTFKSVIDNAQLLFAIRCLDINAESSANLPIVSISYGASRTVTFNNTVENTKKVNVNGIEADMPVKNVKFNVSNKFNKGISHFALIQKSSPSNQIPDKALVVEYSAPMVTYGNFNCMGALVYNLKTVEISN